MRFSCVIGSYNPNREWFARAIHSARCGLFDEVIVVDDGSEMPLLNIWSDSNINYIRHETNQGFYEAKNTAIRNSTGDIIETAL